jgi:pyrimidine-nucleoside phosphorylase
MCLGKSADEAYAMAENALVSGTALGKMREWTVAQGACEKWIDDTENFPKAPFIKELCSGVSGYISRMDAESVGRAACELGAGRKKKNDNIDFSAGIVLRKKTGDYVRKGEALAELHSSDERKLEAGEKLLASAYEFSDTKPERRKLIMDVVR